jgi:type VI secretion system protein ImpH
MAGQAGTQTSSLTKELLEKGHEFSFMQILRLLRVILGPAALEKGRVRVRPELSLSFPAADVARVESLGGSDPVFRVTATFMGLYGPASPLPAFYTEDLLEEVSADGSICREFLDIIHQRLYTLYVRCWSKYRLFVRVEEEQDSGEREKLFCLLGLGEPELAAELSEAWSLIRYAGLLTLFPRSALGLEVFLRDALGMSCISVTQCIRRMVPIPPDQRIRMGLANCRLGIDTIHGCEVADRMGKFRIRIGPLRKNVFDILLPGTPLQKKVTALTKLYVSSPLDFDLELVLAAGEAQPIRLGDPAGPRLGWNMWCYSGDTLGEKRALFPISLM